MDSKAILREVEPFARLDEDSLSRLCALAREETFACGQTIFRQRDPGDRLYVIVRGAVDVGPGEDESGEFIRLARLDAGEILGELSVFDDRPRSATARAAVDGETTLLAFDKKDLDQLLDSDPLLAQRILRGVLRKVSERLRMADEAIQTMLRTLQFTWY